jgi:ketosteroid isomerase-like protein
MRPRCLVRLVALWLLSGAVAAGAGPQAAAAAKLRKDGSPIATHGRETQVNRKLQGAWRLVHVHYSGMPVTGEPRR